jgi:hypothetical protein
MYRNRSSAWGAAFGGICTVTLKLVAEYLEKRGGGGWEGVVNIGGRM